MYRQWPSSLNQYLERGNTAQLEVQDPDSVGFSAAHSSQPSRNRGLARQVIAAGRFKISDFLWKDWNAANDPEIEPPSLAYIS
jgi:hypothetical protein